MQKKIKSDRKDVRVDFVLLQCRYDDNTHTHRPAAKNVIFSFKGPHNSDSGDCQGSTRMKIRFKISTEKQK